MSVKGLVSRIYIEFLQSHSKQTNTMKSLAKDLNKFFTKGDIQVANRHMKLYAYVVISGKNKLKPQWNSTTCLLNGYIRGLATSANGKCRATGTLIQWACRTFAVTFGEQYGNVKFKHAFIIQLSNAFLMQ